ncbi:MAG: DUF932 domain-containing protein [Allosphingosinicella sp.]|uniref:DUF932 domain-containing protein n=1 Tax=Allosphingosinicella sp. TaxID=2823234 RepID=UPI00396447BD
MSGMQPTDAPVTRSPSLSRWQGRPVIQETATWAELRELVPLFQKQDFVAPGEWRPNPYLRAMVRLPLREDEPPVPVGTVGQGYTLVQHRDLGDLCVAALRGLDLFYDRLPCTLNLSHLGEWAHIRFHLADDMSIIPPDGFKVGLCIDLFNSVDGSSRLVLAATWLRLVCKNGMTLRETSGFADVHDRNLDLEGVRDAILRVIGQARHDVELLRGWWEEALIERSLASWIDDQLASRWGKGNAARVFNICREGMDGTPQPFDPAPPSYLGLHRKTPVPGAAVPARTLYDVAQALSWVAGSRPNVEQQRAWLSDIPTLLDQLRQS